MPDALPPPAHNLLEFEEAARARLPTLVYDYFAGGANDGITLRANRAAFEQLSLFCRVLRDVSQRDLSVRLFGRRHPFPALIAPMAFARLAHEEGEVATMRAAAAADVTMSLSTLATTTIEELAEAAPGASRWFQLYVFKDRGLTRSLVERAEAAGYEALLLTVDAPLLGRREADERNAFHLPEGMGPRNLLGTDKDNLGLVAGESTLQRYFVSQLDQSLTWKDVEWLREAAALPVLVKGVVHPDDARLAVGHGASGIVVSNHGGRQLDTSPATIDALPGVVEAVDDRLPVLLDGGVRRGTDIVKALALGASAVLVGRPIMWALAADGEAGVARALALLRAEFDLAMTLCGAASVSDLSPDLVRPA